MVFFRKLSKKLRAYLMAKRKKMKGKSARHGKAQSPYQKYEKTPYKYSAAYREWNSKVRAGINSRNKYAEQAAKERRA